ncbi:MAG: helix-turn-helix domain-containing protein [Gemmatimonadaceae bacterium]
MQSRGAPELRVVACALARQQQAYVADGLRHRGTCRFVATGDDLMRELARADACEVVVLGPQEADGRSTVPLVERIARDWPGGGIALVMFFPARTVPDFSPRSFLLAGAHQLVYEGVNDTALTIAQAVENARRECSADIVFGAIQPLIPAALHPWAHAVVSSPHRVASVTSLASDLGVHRKTLVNRCARLGFLSPAALIAWCRLCVVGHLLERTGATVETIALNLEYPSHTALRNRMKRYTGMKATEVRQAGGLAAVVAAFARRLDEHRGAPGR